nr:MAG TPA: hypothetical protein [Caudoviricetes sp.]
MFLTPSRFKHALIIALVASDGVSNVLNNKQKRGRNLATASLVPLVYVSLLLLRFE